MLQVQVRNGNEVTMLEFPPGATVGVAEQHVAQLLGMEFCTLCYAGARLTDPTLALADVGLSNEAELSAVAERNWLSVVQAGSSIHEVDFARLFKDLRAAWKQDGADEQNQYRYEGKLLSTDEGMEPLLTKLCDAVKSRATAEGQVSAVSDAWRAAYFESRQMLHEEGSNRWEFNRLKVIFFPPREVHMQLDLSL